MEEPEQEPDPADPTADEIALPEDVPEIDMEVPPADAGPGGYAAHANRLLRQSLTVAQAEAVSALSAYESARADFLWLQADLDALERSLTGIAAEDRAALRQLEAARIRFERRAAEAVVRGSTDELQLLISAGGDPNEIAAAQVFLGSILDADDAAVRDYLAARDSVTAELAALADRIVDTRTELTAAREQLFEARKGTIDTQYNLAVVAAGSEIIIKGFVFPVGEPYNFGDSFGAPRMLGTEYEHAHQGTDIMAPMGTPLYACERGVIGRMGGDVLGGIKLWVKGESGTFYYYAHLAGFAEGMHEGKVVEAGDLVGYVGDTGNAKGGAPHLHFEVRPGGGQPVNPYPLLKVVSEMGRSGGQA
jgi:murein DD-endopeptidase MepM/ murein hydrolase activator NlpD